MQKDFVGIRGQLTKLERLDHGLDYMMELPDPPHNEIAKMKNKLQKWRKVLRRKVAGEGRDVEAGHTFESLHNFLHSRKLKYLLAHVHKYSASRSYYPHAC